MLIQGFTCIIKLKLRKVVVISLTVLIFVSQVGYFFLYMLWQYHAKEQMKEQLMAVMPDSSLEIIDADQNNSSIIWQEDGKEFLMGDQLYDVARISKKNGKILIYCLSDKNEERLLQDLSRAVKSGNDNNNEKGKHTIKFFLTYFVSANTEEALISNRAAQLKFVNFCVSLRSSTLEVTLPPPRA